MPEQYVPNEGPIRGQDTFGPVAPVTTEGDAIRLANASE